MADLRGTSRPILLKRLERDLAEFQYNLAREKVKIVELEDSISKAKDHAEKLQQNINTKLQEIEAFKKQFSEDLNG